MNDCLIAHQNPVKMTTYILSTNKTKSKEIRGSGLLVSTSTGASGWIYNENGELFKDNSIMQFLNRGVRKERSKFTKIIKLKILSNKVKLLMDGSKFSLDLILGSILKIKLGKKINVL